MNITEELWAHLRTTVAEQILTLPQNKINNIKRGLCVRGAVGGIKINSNTTCKTREDAGRSIFQTSTGMKVRVWRSRLSEDSGPELDNMQVALQNHTHIPGFQSSRAVGIDSLSALARLLACRWMRCTFYPEISPCEAMKPKDKWGFYMYFHTDMIKS